MLNQLVSILTGGTIGIIATKLFDFLTKRGEQRTAQANRKEDQDDAIRQELWGELSKMRAELTQLQQRHAADVTSLQKLHNSCQTQLLDVQRNLFFKEAQLELLRVRLEEHGIAVGAVNIPPTNSTANSPMPLKDGATPTTLGVIDEKKANANEQRADEAHADAHARTSASASANTNTNTQPNT